MLEQMSSSGAQYGEVVRTDIGRVYGDVSSGASSDAADDFELPHCKIRRNYNCTKCTYYTQNPRAYLIHTRDVHFVKLKIFDCPNCLYASRHHQKLIRHVKMVHGGSASDCPKVEMEPSAAGDIEDQNDRMEDMLEEVEETDDGQMEFDDIEEHDHSEDIKEEITEPIPGKDKLNFYSCDKCYYVTHLRSRYTKHVKYHTMPMIKCTICDFRTPYKWNLDRHMKNHGGNGSFSCFACNFTADIQQSMTVHELNHHTRTPGCSRPDRMGASEAPLVDIPEPMPKEDEGSGGDSSDMGLQYAEKDIASCTSDSSDAIANETNSSRNILLNEDLRSQSPYTNTDDTQKQKRKPRPLPQLIPLNCSTPNQKPPTGEPPAKKFKDSPNSEAMDANLVHKIDLQNEVSFIPLNNERLNLKDTIVRKKNESFFDKLKERLLTETGGDGTLICKNCGFESKCLSEHSVHEKNCAPLASRTTLNTLLPSSSSTRCQNCRHRCKSSADLHIHMQTCKRAGKFQDETQEKLKREFNENKEVKIDKDVEPHPMENVVFVWNNINQEQNKFDTPLDISINDDSTLPDGARNYECETVDENESMNLSPSQAAGKNVFKCPHCPFWASTASRFHVHIVGHLNKKPFECSLCKYKSNWRWDITKHIKLKSARDPEHNDAKVLMTDETGRRNYSKYTKFLAMPVLNEHGENEFHYIDPNKVVEGSVEVDESFGESIDATNPNSEMQPLNLQTQLDKKSDGMDIRDQDGKKAKKTLWKCKKCNYKDSSKEALLEHVREHAKVENGYDDPNNIGNKKLESIIDPADLAYRCGHCNQLSNWKHVIQRHCRLKHDGIIKVITTVKPKLDLTSLALNELSGENCTKCPFRTSDKKTLAIHIQQHQPSLNSIFKCFFCPFFVKDEQDLILHLQVHGVNDPDDYISKSVNCESPLQEMPSSNPTQCATKRHKCTECPYETNSKSQYMYHEQFHRLPADTPYKCPECNYSVSKRHLLHQHLRVHGIIPKKTESEAELESMSSYQRSENSTELTNINIDETPYVWVSAKNEFHKMYKCRYCSYVNSQKSKIPNHEKIHFYLFENSEVVVYKCLDCKFTCDNANKLAEHSKTHGEIYGRIYCPVEEDVPDEEQISKLRKVIELEKIGNSSETISPIDDEAKPESRELKTLYFCQKCPARYYTEIELKVHEKFHDLKLSNKCKNCEFSAAEEEELNLHHVIHSDEYHTKTKMLKFIHNVHSMYREPRLESVHNPESSEVIWIVKPMKINENVETSGKKTNDGKLSKHYYCKECPAKFFKTSALNYHMGLHGGEGEHKCKKCSYAVKNIGNLAKHELLHENEHKMGSCDYESNEDVDFKNIPLSGTDLFQRKTEAQKRVFTVKDKLVKPNDHFPPVLQADPQFGYLMHGNPEFIYPTYLKNGRQKEKRYKCHKCPSAFEKREQYKIHLSLHGSKQRYKCELCDYSVKYYANYVQHMRKHQMNDEAQAERRKSSCGLENDGMEDVKQKDGTEQIKLAIKTMPRGVPKTDFQQFSLRDQQTLRLLQRRRSMANAGMDVNTETPPTKERKLHMCLLCPYTNQRQDALNNHYKRHDDNDCTNTGSHKCSYCDLVVVQSHFLREHLKTHFNHHKSHTPECFVANEEVSFTFKSLDDESKVSDLKLNSLNNDKCNDDKIYVKIKTGELLIE